MSGKKQNNAKQNNAKQSNASSGGIGFTGALLIVFIVLKLLNKIDWSWWWVLSPFWIPASIIGSIFLGIILLTAIDTIRKGR